MIHMKCQDYSLKKSKILFYCSCDWRSKGEMKLNILYSWAFFFISAAHLYEPPITTAADNNFDYFFFFFLFATENKSWHFM